VNTGFRKCNKIIIDGDVAYIYLHGGKIAIIDAEDVERVKKYTWRYNKYGVMTHLPQLSKGLKLSRLILFKSKHETNKRRADHKDHNTLNNRKYNLRPATHQQNLYNQLPQQNASSMYKGVHWHKRNKTWVAYITANKIRKHLGSFIDEIEAAKTYDKAAKKLHKKFAYLNFK
jgi:hypothetical protein